MRVCNVCNSTQPRYKLHPKHVKTTPPFKYLAYQQCLPGCVVAENRTSEVKITLTYVVKSLNVTNDISCKAYDGENAERQQYPSPTSQNIIQKPGKQQGLSEDGNPRDKGKNAYYARAY